MSYTLKTTFPTLPRTQRGMPIVLGADPKGKYFLYTNGHNVVIRDIENPNKCDMYTEHSGNVIVAKYSPSGFYIASGDDRGKIRIWDTINPEHVLSKEYQPIAGIIKDISWSPDSKRMLVAGEGKGTFARAFLVDTGSSVGEISGHSKPINSCDYRQINPFRVVTASEDYSIIMCEGPPFKFSKKIDTHTNFVNCIRYSPNGEKFISGGADGKAFVYDGKNGETIGELGSPAHKGGIYGIAFNPDNSEVLTVSGDKTAKIWDANTYTLIKEFVFGKTLEDMLVSCIWIGNSIITVSLSGFVTYLDRNCPEKPLRVLKGHNKPITALATTPDRKLVFTGCSSGHINIWDLVNGLDDRIVGKPHQSQIQDLVVSGDNLISISMDDTIRFTSISSMQYGNASVKLESQPRAVAVHNNLTAVACVKHVILLQGERIVLTLPISYDGCSVAFNVNGSLLAVGGLNSFHVYNVNNCTLTEAKVVEESGTVRDLAFSPDGQYLATGNDSRYVIAYSLSNYSVKYRSTVHSVKVNSVAWSPDSTHLASAGVDGNVVVHNIEDTFSSLNIKGAHRLSQVNRVIWLDSNVVLSAGQDSNLKQWAITY
ncbi:actin-interacting protein 1 [Octopus bimaculoides]|nr:actin-interacting protein 1 [Octopus bimaculoides]